MLIYEKLKHDEEYRGDALIMRSIFSLSRMATNMNLVSIFRRLKTCCQGHEISLSYEAEPGQGRLYAMAYDTQLLPK